MTGCTFRRYVHDRDACIEIPNAVEFVDMAQLLASELYFRMAYVYTFSLLSTRQLDEGGYKFQRAPQPSPGGPQPWTYLPRDEIKENPVACHQSQDN